MSSVRRRLQLIVLVSVCIASVSIESAFALEAPVLIAGESERGVYPSYAWTRVSDASDYYLLVLRHGDVFIEDVYPASDCDAHRCRVTASLEHPSGRYTWFVIALDPDGNPGTPSLSATFDVAPTKLAVVEPIAPRGGGVAGTPSFQWHHVQDAAGYVLYVVDANGTLVLSRPFLVTEAGCAPTCIVTPDLVLSEGTYFWLVGAFGESGNGPPSSRVLFRVGDPLAPPVLVVPTDVVVSSPATPLTYEWLPVDGAASYLLLLYDLAGGSNARFTAASASTSCTEQSCSVTPEWNLPAGAYVWVVAGVELIGAGPISAPQLFVLVTDAPPPPAAIAPVGRTSPTPSYSWSTAATATAYQIRVEGSSGVAFESTFPAEACDEVVCEVIASLTAEGSYQWRVRGSNAVGFGDWSEPVSFEIDSPRSVAAGRSHSAALGSSGDVWTWGSNQYGELGLGTTIPESTLPVRVETLESVQQVVAGRHHVVALDVNGDVYAWGRNDFGQLGAGGSVGLVSRTPLPVLGLPPIERIGVGDNHSLAVDEDGGLWSWGSNTGGQLGIGDGVSFADTPVRVAADDASEVVAAAGGGLHTLVVRADGSVWVFGSNASGQMGLPELNGSAVPVELTSLDGVVAVTAGESHSIALRKDGRLYAWGLNANGRLGDGTTARRETPTPVLNLPFVTRVSSGRTHSFATSVDGELWGWGNNANGRLGNGETRAAVTPPIPIAGMDEVTEIAPGGQHSLAVTQGDAVWGWGLGVSGQVGDGTKKERRAPTSLSAPQRAWRSGTPTFSPGGGTHVVGNSLRVVLASATQGALIHYTIDGSAPTATAPFIASGESLALNETTTLRALAVAPGSADSNATAEDFELQVSFPSLQPPGGTFNVTQSVLVNCATLDAALHYTTDGTDPDVSDPVVVSGDRIAVDVSQTLRVRGFKTGWSSSQPRIGIFTLQVPFPVLSPPPGAFSDSVAVGVASSHPGDEIHFTLTGLDPTVADGVVSSGAAVNVDRTSTLKVRAWRTGWMTSDLVSATYIVARGALQAPTMLPPPGSFSAPQHVTLSSQIPEAVIRFTTNGTTPTFTSPVFDGEPILMRRDTTLQARAFAADWTPSDVASGSYFVADGAPLAAPSLVPGSGRFRASVNVVFHSTEPGATIRYTTDGSEPDPSSPSIVSGASVLVGRSMRLRARAFTANVHSEIRTEDYWISGAVGAGSEHGLVADGDGVVHAWGHNNKGQVGDGNVPVDRSSPVALQQPAGIVRVEGGAEHSLALDTEGRVWAWGSNGDGQLGSGSGSNAPVPVLLPVFSAEPIVDVAAGDHHSLVLDAAGGVWAWGRDATGQVGNGVGSADVLTPQRVGDLQGVTAIAASASSSFALVTGGIGVGSVWGWGDNTSHVLGDATTERRDAPVQVSGLTDVIQLRAGGGHVLVLRADGSVWSWGDNRSGQLGWADDSTPSRGVPGPVLGLGSGVVGLGAGALHSLVVDASGSVWGFGSNFYHQLGDVTALTNRSAPYRVPGVARVVEVAVGKSFSLALDEDGRVWAWGRNHRSQLAADTSPSAIRGTPLPVESLVASDMTWRSSDVDGDGLATAEELALGTDPTRADSNDDGLLDGAAARSGLSPTDPDTDGDGVLNTEERALGSDPLHPDSDADGIDDGLDAYPLDPSRHQAPSRDPSDVEPPVIDLIEPEAAIRIPMQ